MHAPSIADRRRNGESCHQSAMTWGAFKQCRAVLPRGICMLKRCVKEEHHTFESTVLYIQSFVERQALLMSVQGFSAYSTIPRKIQMQIGAGIPLIHILSMQFNKDTISFSTVIATSLLSFYSSYSGKQWSCIDFSCSAVINMISFTMTAPLPPKKGFSITVWNLCKR